MKRRHLLIGFVIGPLLVGVLGLLLAGSEPALQWAARRVTEASGGKVTVTGLSGSLARTLRIERFQYRTEERVLTVENAEMTWSPAQLLRDRIAIDSLTADSLAVETLKASDKPPSLPQKIALPFDLHIEEARIGTLALGGMPTDLRNVRLRLDADKKQWRLHELSFETVLGKVTGTGTLSTVRPYAVDAALHLLGTDARGDAVISGDLAVLHIDADFNGNGASASARVLASPFDKLALRSLALKAREVDPSRFNPSWPKAALGIDVDSGIRDDGLLAGAMKLDNPLAGPWDKGLLPLRSAGARLAGTLDAAKLESILLDFGKAGSFNGSGSISGGASKFALHTSRFDLKGIHGRMNATRIAGDIVLTDSGGVQALDARLGENRMRLDLNAAKERNLVKIREAVLRAGKSEASISGEILMVEERSFRLEGRSRRFNPASFGSWPAADMNVDIEARGRLAPTWQLAASYEVQPSQMFGQPLTGSGRFDLDSRHARGVDAALALGPNKASAKGNFGLPGDRLQWRIEAPRLDVFGAGLKGALQGEGELGGTLDAPRLQLELDGKGLAAAGYAAQSLRAKATVSEGERDPLSVDVQASEASGGGISLQSASLQVDGTRTAHVVNLNARNSDIRLAAEAAGGWRKGSGWEGTIRSLDNSGTYGFALQQAAPLRIGVNGDMSLRDFVLALEGGGNVSIAVLERAGAQMQTRGSARGVPLASLFMLSPDLKESLQTDLTLGADWAFTAAETVNGKLRVFREQGDVTLRQNAELPLGLSVLEAGAVIDRNAVRADLVAEGKQLGSIRANAGTQIVKQNGAWTLPMSSPLSLKAAVAIPSLAWVGPVSGNPGIEAGGSLALDVTSNGTIGRPRLSGTMAGDNLTLRWAEQGINLRNGILRAQLQGDGLQIVQASISGEQGTLRVEGGARMTGHELRVDMKLLADKLMLLARPDRTLVLSGESTLALDQSRLQLAGKLKADRARLEFPEQKGLTVSEDVVVLGRERRQEAARPLPVQYDFEFDLGREFFVRGRGVDARLAGNVRVFSTPQDRLPRARGTIRVEEGTYEAYGQKLTIERGLITFNGPVNNPSLDILAVRKPPSVEGAVEAGVQVRGTALSPNARLVSTPSVSDTEKLSWLVLGRGIDQARGQDYGVLTAAAGALFGSSQASSLQSRLANTFGIDEFGVSSGTGTGVEGAVVTLGKRISSNVYLAFEQGVSGATSLVKLRYLLSRRLTLEVGTGTSSTVDVIYNWRFD